MLLETGPLLLDKAHVGSPKVLGTNLPILVFWEKRKKKHDVRYICYF